MIKSLCVFSSAPMRRPSSWIYLQNRRVYSSFSGTRDIRLAGRRRFYKEVGVQPVSPPWRQYIVSNVHETDFTKIVRALTTAKSPYGYDQKKSKESIERVDQAFADYLTGKANSFDQEKEPVSKDISTQSLEHTNTSTDREIAPIISESEKSEKSSSSSAKAPTHTPSSSNSDEWYNTLHKHQTDFGRPTITDLSEIYRRLESTQQRNLQESRGRRIDTVHRALLGNVVITVFKFTAYLSSGSSAMLSECIHSIVDCGNQSLLLIGLRHSSRPTDRVHPYVSIIEENDDLVRLLIESSPITMVCLT
jgi:hypothetical protein